MTFQDIIALSDLAIELRSLGITKSYTTLHRHVLSGSIPASRVGKSWVIHRSDLPDIAARLGAANRHISA